MKVLNDSGALLYHSDTPIFKRSLVESVGIVTAFCILLPLDFPKRGVERILDKTDFYYTAKHGSWRNITKIEISMMGRECPARRIGEAEKLIREMKHWSDDRNGAKKKIDWTFTKLDADKKLSEHYVA